LAGIRLGILGLGRIGRIHLENLCTKIAGVEVIAAMNPSAEGRFFAQRFKVPLVTDNAMDVLHHPDIDAVLICSPTSTHADYVIEAARAGKAIFCEKPLDLSLDKVRQTLQIVKTGFFGKTGKALYSAYYQQRPRTSTSQLHKTIRWPVYGHDDTRF
jgi:myo-inositol 2-dehydrogenase / D-chiro-inositol 1-dehydrogenase